jgi:preprotein translocase subunit SecD
MLDFPRWKKWLVLVTCAIGVLLAVPSIAPLPWMPAWVQSIKINLGLDLKGGVHLLFAADTQDVSKQWLTEMEETVGTALRRADTPVQIGDIAIADGTLSFMVRDTHQLDAAVKIAREQTNGLGVTGQRDWDVAVRDGNLVTMTPSAAGLSKRIVDQMEVARSVIEKRINPDGTKDVTVVLQGSDRILVQVPGEQDPERVKGLVGKTAKLEFKLVDMNATADQIASGNAPAGSQILPYVKKGGAIAVQRRVMVSGDQLLDASQTYEQTTNAPVVSIRFNAQGGKRFARATSENVGKPFAIIIDNEVLSAPNINEPILGGSAQISGGFTVESANDLAIQLRSGKLPVALKVVEERTVGPDLGADSIHKGVLAGVIATVALMAYMLLTYLRFGTYTCLALALNGFMILGGMALFNATLTLPGIAGFVLTIGAAVDANVLIFERIREEARRGRNTIASCEFGYKEAGSAIFDANITNVISAIIMFWFGTGPIRGFAVVLAIGIVTSVFTGVTFTRLMVANYLERARPRELNL